MLVEICPDWILTACVLLRSAGQASTAVLQRVTGYDVVHDAIVLMPSSDDAIELTPRCASEPITPWMWLLIVYLTLHLH
jgi:hypothetical protein